MKRTGTSVDKQIEDLTLQEVKDMCIAIGPNYTDCVSCPFYEHGDVYNCLAGDLTMHDLEGTIHDRISASESSN